MIKLSNIKKALLAGVVATTILATSLTAFAADDDYTGNTVAKDGAIAFDIAQSWNTGGVADSKLHETVHYIVTAKDSDTYDYTGVSLTPESFTLEGNGDDATTQTVSFSADHAGVFTYYIKADTSLNKADPGYTYDGTTYTIRAYVKSVDGELVTTITAQKDDSDAKVASVAFEHTFKPIRSNETKDRDGNVVSDPPVQKVVKGDSPRTEDEFTFSITPDEENPEQDLYPYYNGVEQRTVTLRPSKELTAEFGDFTFSKVGTYKFYVREVDNDLSGYTYDDIIYTVVYEVGVDKTTNELTCTRYFIVDGEQVDTPIKDSNYYLFTNTFDDPDKRNKGGGSNDSSDRHHHHDDSGSASTGAPTQQIAEAGNTTTGETPAADGIGEITETGSEGNNVGGATGDASNMMLYAGVLVAAALCLIGWLTYTRKNHNK